MRQAKLGLERAVLRTPGEVGEKLLLQTTELEGILGGEERKTEHFGPLKPNTDAT